MLVSRLFQLESVDSTNLELARMDLEQLPDFSAVCAMHQTRGQGRLGRSWSSEPESSVSVSVLLKVSAPIEQLAWFTLMGGLAARATIDSFISETAVVKWPNDVLVQGKKLAGVLARLEPQGVILGIGLNLKQQLEAPQTAGSLSEFGAEVGYDDVLAELLSNLRARYNKFLADPNWAIDTFRTELQDHCITIGQSVRAIYPDGSEFTGQAIAIEPSGNLVIRGASEVSVAAADIIHLRN